MRLWIDRSRVTTATTVEEIANDWFGSTAVILEPKNAIIIAATGITIPSVICQRDRARAQIAPNPPFSSLHLALERFDLTSVGRSIIMNFKMFQSNPILLTLGDILKQRELPACEGLPTAQATLRAEREWYGAIAAIECLLARATQDPHCAEAPGLVLSSPTPVLSHPTLLAQYQIGVFAPATLDSLHQLQLPAAPTSPQRDRVEAPQIEEYPLLSVDPLANEQFCLVLTQPLAVVMVLAVDDSEGSAMRFSFDPDVLPKLGRVCDRVSPLPIPKICNPSIASSLKSRLRPPTIAW
jgi:hypothetical protein